MLNTKKRERKRGNSFFIFNMKIPTEKECLGLFAEHKVPSNILLHSKAVCRVSLFLANKLKKKGVDVNIDLVRSGALLHDLMKAVVIGELKEDKKFKLEKPTKEMINHWSNMKKKHKGKHETEVTYEILKHEFPEFARFIIEVGLSSKAFHKIKGWEEKIIHYADWRVFVDDIVPLKERIDDLSRRYNKKGPEWEKIKKSEFELEKEICELIGIKPENLKEKIKGLNTML